ncbi:acyl-CoA thioesterase [Ideonella sp. 4Y11]|uniref:Acyl-CoA thioesterase n=1 Tax=Ideonella aquatica TaxID=2824119 RepID=A0A941BPE0_9BURK|nr:thioesterase family protein [Ideonella aquatica]MBQ0957960.1 acyl-CoA thioesterase [Ideonella aquatica]
MNLWLDPQGRLCHRHRLRVRFGECDPMQVAYHPNYLVWFHEARDALMTALGVDLFGLAREGHAMPIVDASCRYLHSARYGDELVVQAGLRLSGHVARVSCDFQITHARSGRLLATGTTVSAVLDRQGRMLLRLPDSITHVLDRVRSAQLPEECPA